MNRLKKGSIAAVALAAAATTPAFAAPDGTLTPKGVGQDSGVSLLGFYRLNLAGTDLKELYLDAFRAKYRFASGGPNQCACTGTGTGSGSGSGSGGGSGGGSG